VIRADSALLLGGIALA